MHSMFFLKLYTFHLNIFDDLVKGWGDKLSIFMVVDRIQHNVVILFGFY